MTPERALYLYAAVPGDTTVDTLRGVGDEPVEVLTASGLGLAVSDVATDVLAAIGAEDADPRLLGAFAQRHDSVVRAVAASGGATLPFRLGTVVTDRQAAQRFLTTRATVLRAQLERVAGCDEWGVTVRDDGEPDAETEPQAVESGTAYLMRRRQHFDRVEQRRRMARRLVAETEVTLGEVARDAAPGRRQGNLLLDLAYLVRRGEQARFVEALDRCGDRLAADDLALRVTGPWPPYSFVDVTVAADE